MSEPFQLQKTSTGMAGLDQILEGGLPRKRTSIISGGPGCGKTVMGIQFILDGVKNHEPGIFISFEETKPALRENAATLGWDLAALEENGSLLLLDNPISTEVVIAGNICLSGLRSIIQNAIVKMGAKRVVFDALDVLFSLLDDHQERKELFLLKEMILENGVTAIFTTKPATPDAFATYEFMDSLVDCVIKLDQRVENYITTPRLRIKKYRGSKFGRNEYPYIIDTGGITLIPISTVGLRHRPLGEFISTGQPDLDDVMGGGYRRASSVLIAGVTGTGKTSLAATFCQSICDHGEKLLYFSFEESREAMMTNMLSPGINLTPAMTSGRFRYISSLPESMGSEEHLLRAYREIEGFEPHHVVIDAISACHRIGSERTAFEFLVRLLNICKERGITCILLNQTTSPDSIQELTGIEISSIIDAVISLHYVEENGEINRTLICIKSRGSHHSNQFREYQITDHGIKLIPVYQGDGKVLTGTARRFQEEKEKGRQLELDLKIEEKKMELKRLKIAREQLEKESVSQMHMRRRHRESE